MISGGLEANKGAASIKPARTQPPLSLHHLKRSARSSEFSYWTEGFTSGATPANLFTTSIYREVEYWVR